MATRVSSGSKIVAAAVALTVGAVGISTLYLPFIADKDKLRGLDEDGGMMESEKREYERAMRQMAAEAEMRRTTPGTSNSMWKRMDQSSRES